MADNSNEARARKIADKIIKQVREAASMGLNQGRIFLVNRIQEEISIPAPKRKVMGRVGGVMTWIGGYRVTEKATPGAPIRKVTGRALQSLYSRMLSQYEAVIGMYARSSKGFNYPKFHEIKDTAHPRSGQHPFMLPTALKYKRELKLIVVRQVAIEFR